MSEQTQKLIEELLDAYKQTGNMRFLAKAIALQTGKEFSYEPRD